MRRLVAAALLLLSGHHAASARGYIHQPAVPEPLRRDTVVCDTLPDFCTEVRYEVRMAPETRHEQHWALIWGDPQGLRHHLTLRQKPAGHGDELYPDEVELTLTTENHGEMTSSHSCEIIKKSKSHHGGRGDAMILIADRSSCRVHLSDDGVYHTVENVPFSLEHPCTVGCYALSDDMAVVRRELTVEAADRPEAAPYADVDALMAAIECSGDSVAGVWSYLDRTIDGAVAALHSRYTLAVVPDGSGDGYLMVYLGGAGRHDSPWQPLMVKGRLKGGRWRDHYDLTWRDAAGRLLADDTDAYCVTDMSAGVMTLEFPGLRSSVRLKRER